MLKFILASGNEHKALEFEKLLNQEYLCVTAAPEKISVVEDGITYFENAFKKAKSYFESVKVAVLADDSGLNIESLPNELGIESARFGGEGLTDRQRAELLLEKMRVFPEMEQRKAYFSCILCFYFSDKEIFYFEGRVNGHIGHEYKGQTGFGYDPVFIPEALAEQGTTFAECDDWKQQNSHRAKACQMANKFFSQSNCQNT